MISVQASSHQGHSKYRGKGRQCMANSLAAILKSYNRKPGSWAPPDLDDILHDGDEIYTAIQSDKYLMLEDLPKELDGYYHILRISNILTGSTLRKASTDCMYYSLEEALNKTLSKHGSCAILTIGQSTPCYSCAVLHEDEAFFLFDPHSRSDAGMSTPDGFATVTEHSSVNALILFIRHLSATLSEVRDLPFEIAEINVIVDPEKDLDEFDGFSGSEVSEGEVSCLIYMAQNMSDDSISTVSSVASETAVLSDVDIEQLHNDSSVFMQSFDDNVFDDVSCTNNSESELEFEEQPHNDMNILQFDDCFQQTAEVIVNSAAETDDISRSDASDVFLSAHTSKSAQGSESVQGSGSIQDSESVQAAESFQNSESVQAPESVQNSESVQGSGSILSSESVQGSGSIQNSESVQGSRSIQNSESVHGSGSIQYSESVQGSGSI